MEQVKHASICSLTSASAAAEGTAETIPSAFMARIIWFMMFCISSCARA